MTRALPFRAQEPSQSPLVAETSAHNPAAVVVDEEKLESEREREETRRARHEACRVCCWGATVLGALAMLLVALIIHKARACPATRARCARARRSRADTHSAHACMRWLARRRARTAAQETEVYGPGAGLVIDADTSMYAVKWTFYWDRNTVGMKRKAYKEPQLPAPASAKAGATGSDSQAPPTALYVYSGRADSVTLTG